MKKVLLLSVLLLQFSFYAQDNSKWKMGIEFSTEDLSLSDASDGKGYLVTEGNLNGFAMEFDRYNYSLGLTTEYLVKEKISFSSGILYSNKDFTGTFNCATCDYIGTFPGYSPEIIKQRFLVIPVSVNYKFSTRKFIPTINGGFKNNLEVKSDLKEQSKSYFLEAFIGASVYYGFFKNWEAGIGYNYQAAVTGLYKTDEFNLRTNSFFLKINYNIK